MERQLDYNPMVRGLAELSKALEGDDVEQRVALLYTIYVRNFPKRTHTALPFVRPGVSSALCYQWHPHTGAIFYHSTSIASQTRVFRSAKKPLGMGSDPYANGSNQH